MTWWIHIFLVFCTSHMSVFPSACSVTRLIRPETLFLKHEDLAMKAISKWTSHFTLVFLVYSSLHHVLPWDINALGHEMSVVQIWKSLHLCTAQTQHTSHLTSTRWPLATARQQVGAVTALTQPLICVTHQQQDQQPPHHLGESIPSKIHWIPSWTRGALKELNCGAFMVNPEPKWPNECEKDFEKKKILFYWV